MDRLNLQKLTYLASMALLVYGIKRWYSHARLDEMQWVMLPLTHMLEIFLPGRFEAQAHGEWIHHGWQILLVKGCSGVNFFLMSLMGYAAIFAKKVATPSPAFLIRVAGYMVFALVAAWLTALVVNTLRIMLAMSVVRNHLWFDWTHLSDESLHRLIGMLVYFPVLVIQMQIGRWRGVTGAYAQAAAIALFMLIVVPLMTGNALHNTQTFLEHCAWLLLTIGGCLALLLATHRFSVRLSVVADSLTGQQGTAPKSHDGRAA